MGRWQQAHILIHSLNTSLSQKESIQRKEYFWKFKQEV